MTKFALAAVALLCVQQQAQNPDLKYVKDMGVSLQKAPKNDEWDFKETGFYTGSQIVLSHKVDSISVEILSFAVEAGRIWEAKTQCKAEMDRFAKDDKFKDVKTKDPKAGKLPGNAASNVNTYYGEATFKLNDKPMEFRLWTFQGKESQNGYLVVVWGDEGMYRKYQKPIEMALASIRIWRLPK